MPTAPDRFTKALIAERVRFSTEDRTRIARCRRDHNRLGFAYQLGFLKLTGRLPKQQPLEIVGDLLSYVARQMGLDSAVIEEYAQRQPTVSVHAHQVQEHLGYHPFGVNERATLERFLEDEVEHLEQTAALVAKAAEHLRMCKILLPARSTLRRSAEHARETFRSRLFDRVERLLSTPLKVKLDTLLKVGSEGTSPIQMLKEPSGMASPRALKAEAAKLEMIEDTGILDIDLSWIRGSLRKALSRRALRSDAHRLRELKPPHRYGALACFLHEQHGEIIDTMVEMHGRLMTSTYRRAQNRLDEELKQHRKEILRTLRSFRTISQLVLDEDLADEDLRTAVLRQISAETLQRQLQSTETWLTGRRSDVFPLVQDRFSYLRQFSPTLFEKLTFKADPTGNPDLTEAIGILREMNAAGKRKVPKDAPTSFLKKKTRPFIETNDDLNRAGYESAVLTAIRDEIRRGNLFVEGSKRFRQVEDFFMPDEAWESTRDDFFARSGLPPDPKAAAGELKTRLDEAYNRFLVGLPQNAYVSIGEDGGWHLAADPAQELSREDTGHLHELTTWLEKNVRHIRLPDLLIEVDNALQFTRHFFPKGRAQRSREGVCQAVAAVIAYGCNLGPVGMARQTKGVTYKQIKRIADWHLHEDALRGALADVTNGIATLDTAKVWGDASTSSSDGQRFLFPRKTVKRTYSHRLSDYALEFYTFVADNYAPFYSAPIECTERDAAYVLDGLLYHESDLEPEEHYTDTHGYTECNFAAFALLGKRFCPRIRGLSKQRIYHAGRPQGYGPLEPLFAGSRRRIRFDWIEEQWDRIAQLVASFAYGHTTASVVMKRLVSFGATNRLYRATRELGRLFKTEFMLNYMMQPQLRRRVRQGLLKSEEIHAMARSVFYGKLGRADWRDFRRQMSSASCLLLVLAAIIYWQIGEIEQAIASAEEQELDTLQLNLLSRVSPAGWENVQLYGQYVLRPGLVRI